MSIFQTFCDWYYFIPKIIIAQQILDFLMPLVVFLKKAIKTLVWISEEWLGVVRSPQTLPRIYLPMNAECDKCPRTRINRDQGWGSSNMGICFHPPQSGASWRPPCVWCSVSVGRVRGKLCLCHILGTKRWPGLGKAHSTVMLAQASPVECGTISTGTRNGCF